MSSPTIVAGIMKVYDSTSTSAAKDSFESYIQKQLYMLSNKLPSGLTDKQNLSLHHEILSGIRYGTLDMWRDTIDAMIDTLAIGFKARHRIGKEWVPPGRMWMLYDASVTTMWKDAETTSRFQEFVKGRQEGERSEARERRHIAEERRMELLKRGRTSRGRVGDLIDSVANLFAEDLLKELEVANGIGVSTHTSERSLDEWEILDGASETKPSSLGGLFAKWTPTPGGMHDKALSMAPLIREKLLELLREEGSRGLREELLCSAGDRARDNNGPIPLEHLSLQRDVLTPLRRMAEVPEHFVGAGTARGGVNYRRMASRCRMIFGEKVFRRLDGENYDRFLVDAAKLALLKQLQISMQGKSAKVNAGVLAPHEVMLKAVEAKASTSLVAMVESGLQWQALLASCTQPAGKSKRLIIPMCDVSGSMACPSGDGGEGTCMDVACALSLLLTDSLPEDNAFYGKILTFSENPEFVDMRAEKKADLTVEAIEAAITLDEIAALLPDLAGRVHKLKGSDWGGSTDFFGAMKRICDLAQENNLTAEDVSGLELVVFSDMEFNQAQYGQARNERTMLQKIRRLFVDRFGPAAAAHPPKIVFWNLRASSSGSGVAKDSEEGSVALLSGVSASLIKKYLSWDLSTGSSDDEARGTRRSAEARMNPTKAMLTCLRDPLYQTLRLEKDLREWEVLVSEEEIMGRSEKARGENMELVHVSNSSALVAFFFEAVPGIGAKGLEDLLDAAFEENPRTALELLFNLGSVRRHAAGKADRENFQLALLWLWRNWPETYLLNVAPIARFTSLKELLNSTMFILYEGERERDPEGYALYSLAGQKEVLRQHRSRQQCRNNRARRKVKKARRLRLWSDFARSEGKKLFGDLRVERGWDELKEKLCITEVKRREWRQEEWLELAEEEGSFFAYEESWEMKERVATRRAVSLGKKRSKRARTSHRSRERQG